MMTSTRSFAGKNMDAMMARADNNRAQTCKGTTTTTDNSSANKGASRSASTTTKGHEANRIEHNYHDYAAVTEVPMQVAPRTEPKASGGVSNPFPVVLHKLLSQADQMGFSDVISWQPHGRSFLIHQPKEFVRDIVPRYFKHSKLSSFQRQLSLYGFMRLCQESPDKGSYFHEVSVLFTDGDTVVSSRDLETLTARFLDIHSCFFVVVFRCVPKSKELG
jgi:hypothetical protein